MSPPIAPHLYLDAEAGRAAPEGWEWDTRCGVWRGPGWTISRSVAGGWWLSKALNGEGARWFMFAYDAMQEVQRATT